MQQKQQQRRSSREAATEADTTTTDSSSTEHAQQVSEDAACCLLAIDEALADSDQEILDRGLHLEDLYDEYDRIAGKEDDADAASYAAADKWWGEVGGPEATRRRDRYAQAYERVYGITWNPCTCG